MSSLLITQAILEFAKVLNKLEVGHENLDSVSRVVMAMEEGEYVQVSHHKPLAWNCHFL